MPLLRLLAEGDAYQKVIAWQEIEKAMKLADSANEAIKEVVTLKESMALAPLAVEASASKTFLNLYLLRCIYGASWPLHDTYDSFVIAAYSEESARSQAASRSGDEGEDVWLHEEATSVLYLGPAVTSDSEHIVLSSFNAG